LEFVRLSPAKFFLARGGGLVGADESLILDCYRLAKYYSTSPDIFLQLPISEVQLHLYRTIQLTNLMLREHEEHE
jgi:hypothetical protein